ELPHLRRRYDAVHECAAALRWCRGNLDQVPDGDWWRFDRPDRVWRWKAARAKTVRAAAFGEHDGHRVRFITISGHPEPSLVDIAAHRDQWQPGIVDADRLLERAKAAIETPVYLYEGD